MGYGNFSKQDMFTDGVLYPRGPEDNSLLLNGSQKAQLIISTHFCYYTLRETLFIRYYYYLLLTSNVADSPPLVKILSNITYKYALEAQFGFASIYPTGICDNYNSQRGRFNDSLLGTHSILRPELYGLLCGTTCVMKKTNFNNIAPESTNTGSPSLNSSATDNHSSSFGPSQTPIPTSGPVMVPINPAETPMVLEDPVIAAIYRAAIQRFRANAFVTQMLIAFNASPKVWTVLCSELDALALDTMFTTNMPKELACEMVNITSNQPEPNAQQPNPSQFSFSRLLRVNGELLGGAARASFSSASALREACDIIGQSAEVHYRLEMLDVSWVDFHRALCGSGWWFTTQPPSPQIIWEGLGRAMVNVFAQSLWLAGSSREFRKLICEGHNSDDGRLLAFNRSALVALGMEDLHLDKAIGERCGAVNL
jgi:hypothetical protein